MNTIISQTKETIAIKKKQIDSNRMFINQSILDLNEKVRQNYELQMQIENLDSDLYSLEKSQQPQAMSPGEAYGSNDRAKMVITRESEKMANKPANW